MYATKSISLIKCCVLLIIISFLITSTECRNRNRRRKAKEKNCYDKLGVGTDASDREIKKKFRKLAMKYHPDKVSEQDKESAEDKFKELALCYEILSDKEKRQKYDASGYNEQFESHGGGPGGFHFEGSFEDIFNSFFGGKKQGFQGGFSSGSNGGGFGGPFGGFGDMGDMFGNMGGAGRRQQQQQQNMYGQHHTHEPRTRSAPKRQKVYVKLEDLMTDSFKTVKSKRGNRIDLEIPAGCPDGHIIEEQGMEFEIYTKKNDNFYRGTLSHKSDLYKNESINLDEALLGFDLEIKNIDNELIKINIDKLPYSKQYQIKRKGLPRYGGDTRGHLYINFDVQFPILTKNQKQSLKNMIESNGEEWDYSEAKKYREKQQKRKKRRNKQKTEL